MSDWIEGDIQANGIKTHYYRTGGDKPPLILLHGATDNGLCWTPVAKLLSGQYDVIMPDAQGHGLSDRIDPDFTYTNHVDQLVGLVQELEIEKPVLMGHSMGAGTAANTAARYPDLPKAVILEDPGWRSGKSSESSQADEIDEDEGERRHRLFTRWIRGLQKKTREELITRCRKENPSWAEEELGPWADSKSQFDPAFFSAMPAKFSYYEDLVAKIECPILLITSDGGIVSPEIAGHASDLWRVEHLSRWAKINCAGHNIRREQFKDYCQIVYQFLEDI